MAGCTAIAACAARTVGLPFRRRLCWLPVEPLLAPIIAFEAVIALWTIAAIESFPALASVRGPIRTTILTTLLTTIWAVLRKTTLRVATRAISMLMLGAVIAISFLPLLWTTILETLVFE